MNLYTIQKDCKNMEKYETDVFKCHVLDMIRFLAEELEKVNRNDS